MSHIQAEMIHDFLVCNLMVWYKVFFRGSSENRLIKAIIWQLAFFICRLSTLAFLKVSIVANGLLSQADEIYVGQNYEL